jgi:site-specific DNA-cytosine methylase
MTPLEHIFTALFPFCGIGGGALGFQQAEARLLRRCGRFRSLGGIDCDPLAAQDFERLTKSPCLVADIAEMTACDLVRFCPVSPDCVFLSPPCKGFSGLLGSAAARAPRYRALNRLVLHWTQIMLEAWRNRLPGLVLIENVPRIASRGRHLLRKVRKLLRQAGYVFHEQSHDCGELGGLAQRRRRFLLVGRLPSRISPLLYQPPKRRVRACGEVLESLPMPNDPAGGPLHVMPRISWLNWVRLALIPAGGDWRDLPGVLGDLERRAVHKRHAVEDWATPTGAVAGSGSNGVENVADPRIVPQRENKSAHWNKYSVGAWDEPSATVIGASRPGSGAPAVADPRVGYRDTFGGGALGVKPWNEPLGTVTGNSVPSGGTFAVADPRVRVAYDHGYRILRWDEPSFVVHGKAHPGTGAYSVADVRVPSESRTGAYGVIAWTEAAKTVTGVAGIDNGAWAVADPRLPDARPVMVIEDIRKPPPLVPVIIAADGTWHRPLTTLELAALQGFPTEVDGKPLELAGKSSTAWRERIGNAVPPPAARAIAEQMLIALIEEAESTMLMRADGAVWVTPEAEVPR